MSRFNLEKIQSILRSMDFDAWLLYDFRGMNDLALSILGVPKESHLTRRFFYVIPKQGEPTKIVMGIEAMNLDHLPGKRLVYSNHTSLLEHLKDALKPFKNVAMEYSPMNAIPYVSKVDAGTIEVIKSLGLEVKSSADLISMINS